LALLVRPARHRESPGDERPDISRPARLHTKASEIDIRALPDDLLAGRRGTLLRAHVHHLHQDPPRALPRIAQALGWLAPLQVREELPDLGKARDRFLA